MDNFDLKKYLAENKLNENELDGNENELDKNELSYFEKYPNAKDVRDHALKLSKIFDDISANPENSLAGKDLFPTYNKLVRAMKKYSKPTYPMW
jgi:hypothetical protein